VPKAEQQAEEWQTTTIRHARMSSSASLSEWKTESAVSD
jgi:hypothetical protein